MKVKGWAPKKGFTLVELLIVLAIIAILSVIAIPSYRKYVMEARQTDARVQLRAIYLAEELYHSTHNTYTADTTKLTGWKDRVKAYTFTIVSADKDHFKAKAQGNLDSDETLDTWEIDETGTITHTVDDAEN